MEEQSEQIVQNLRKFGGVQNLQVVLTGACIVCLGRGLWRAARERGGVKSKNT